MYNRYIRNDHGTYSRVTEEDSAGTAAQRNVPGSSNSRGKTGPSPPHAPERNGAGGPPCGETGSNTTRGGSAESGWAAADGYTSDPNFGGTGSAARQSAANEGGRGYGGRPGSGSPWPSGGAAEVKDAATRTLRRLLDRFHLENVDTGDLLLVLLVFLLFREDADEELLIALGLLLIL